MSFVLSVLFPALLASAPAAAQIPAVTGVLDVSAAAEVPHDGQPTITLSAPGYTSVLYLECPVGEGRKSFTSEQLAPGDRFEVTLPVGPEVDAVTCLAVARFPNGLSERKEVALSWTWAPPPPPPAAEPEPDPAASPDAEAPPASTEEPRIKPLGTPDDDAEAPADE